VTRSETAEHDELRHTYFLRGFSCILLTCSDFPQSLYTDIVRIPIIDHVRFVVYCTGEMCNPLISRYVCLVVDT
jgi:hypothetical protein